MRSVGNRPQAIADQTRSTNAKCSRGSTSPAIDALGTDQGLPWAAGLSRCEKLPWLMSGYGTFETCQRTLRMSADRRRAEVRDALSKRHIKALGAQLFNLEYLRL